MCSHTCACTYTPPRPHVCAHTRTHVHAHGHTLVLTHPCTHSHPRRPGCGRCRGGTACAGGGVRRGGPGWGVLGLSSFSRCYGDVEGPGSPPGLEEMERERGWDRDGVGGAVALAPRCTRPAAGLRGRGQGPGCQRGRARGAGRHRKGRGERGAAQGFSIPGPPRPTRSLPPPAGGTALPGDPPLRSGPPVFLSCRGRCAARGRLRRRSSR